mgnify:CR=1 FL=1
MDDYNPRTRYEHYYVRMARLEGRGELQKRYPDDFYVRPFQIAGNVYYIGNKAVCSHLIDTGEGLIVIDTSYPELDHLLINSIWEAGFDPKAYPDRAAHAPSLRPLWCHEHPDKDLRWQRPMLAGMNGKACSASRSLPLSRRIHISVTG